jgi:hypothetical protein
MHLHKNTMSILLRHIVEGGLRASEGEEFSRLTCVRRDISVIKIIKSSSWITFIPICWSTECNCSVWTDWEVVFAVASCLDGIVELELIVSSCDVSESAVLIFQGAVDESKREIAGSTRSWGWGSASWSSGRRGSSSLWLPVADLRDGGGLRLSVADLRDSGSLRLTVGDLGDGWGLDLTIADLGDCRSLRLSVWDLGDLSPSLRLSVWDLRDGGRLDLTVSDLRGLRLAIFELRDGCLSICAGYCGTGLGICSNWQLEFTIVGCSALLSVYFVRMRYWGISLSWLQCHWGSEGWDEGG